MKFRPGRKTVIIPLASVLLIICFGYLFIKAILPGLLVNQYKGQINTAFSSSFTKDLDSKLNQAGIVMTENAPVSCSDGPYSPSSPCTRYSSSQRIQLGQSSAAKFKENAKELDNYLAKQGWQRSSNYKETTFSNLLDYEGEDNDAYQVFATYTKQEDGVDCAFSGEYLRPYPSGPDKYGTLSFYEGCSKHSDSPSEWFN